MKRVKPKKHLGQHFLKDATIAEAIVDAFNQDRKSCNALEVGFGMGVLTKFLIERSDLNLSIIDIDSESIKYIHQQIEIAPEKLIEGDFLKLDLKQLFKGEKFSIIGNFPYNISTQILFKTLEHKDQVKEVVGMFQKEVAERIVSPEGSKVYGISSVLLQAYYDMEYLFTVDENVFNPPPKVKSAVIRLRRNDTLKLNCNEKRFTSLVKMAFNQRRKTMRNSLKSILPEELKNKEIFSKRPEQLSVQDFIALTNLLTT